MRSGALVRVAFLGGCGLAVALLTGGCSNNAPGDINGAAEKVLGPAVQHVREVAATHNYAELRAAVAELRNLVQQERDSGDVTASRAAAIDDAADVLLLDAKPKPKPTPSTTSPTPTPTTESPTPTPTVTTVSPTPTTSPIISTSTSTSPSAQAVGSPRGTSSPG